MPDENGVAHRWLMEKIERVEQQRIAGDPQDPIKPEDEDLWIRYHIAKETARLTVTGLKECLPELIKGSMSTAIENTCPTVIKRALYKERHKGLGRWSDEARDKGPVGLVGGLLGAAVLYIASHWPG